MAVSFFEGCKLIVAKLSVHVTGSISYSVCNVTFKNQVNFQLAFAPDLQTGCILYLLHQ